MPGLKEMKPTYKIFVLDDDEYLGLHKYIPEVKKEDLGISVGFSNPKTKEAYIRRTNCKEMDDETIIHEAEELLAKNSSHEDENNIRWKKGMDIITPIAQVVATITGHPYIAAAIGAARGGYKQATNQGTLGETLISTATPLVAGAMGAGNVGGTAYNAARAGGQGIIGSTGQALKAGVGNLLGVTPAATTGTTGTNLAPVTLKSGLEASQAGLSTPLTLGGITSNVTGSAGGGLSAITSQIPNLLGNTIQASKQTPAIPTTIQPTTTQTVGQTATEVPKKTFMEQAKSLVTPQNILGGASLLGSMAPKTPEFTMPSQFTELQNKLMTGQTLSPLGQQAQTELSNILKSSPTELYPTANDEYYNAALRRTRESYAEAEKQLDAAYNVAGVYGSGEHLAAKGKLKEELARTESAMAAEIEQRRFELATTEKYNAIQQALGVDQNVMSDLLGLTGLSVQTAAAMYNAEVADVEEIRKALGTLGSELIIKGTTGQAKGTQGVTINLAK